MLDKKKINNNTSKTPWSTVLRDKIMGVRIYVRDSTEYSHLDFGIKVHRVKSHKTTV